MKNKPKSSEGKGIKREIKFRAWNKNLGGWDNAITGRTESKPFTIYQVTNLSIEENKHLDIQQYTGLKDKNGKEIYEGDIVMIYDAREPEPFPIISEKVIFEKGKFMTEGEFDLFDTDNYSYEIIGNIYENKEILK